MATQKPHLNVAFIGHVDHGKSTSVGQLLVMHGDISSDLVKKFEVMGEKGKTFKFAWVMDNLKEERERGVTIDLSHKKFETDSKYITIVDCPGHRDFVKNMITGASQADAAVLVVAVNDGIMPQTQEHVFLSRTLGIQQLAVLINKMDTVNYSQEKFDAIKAEVEKLIRTVGFKVEETRFIPASAFNGDNIVTKSDKTPWYTGPTLLEAVDSFKEPDKPTDKPLRLPIQDVYTITGVGTVPVGRVETGVMKKGDTVVFEPASTVFGKQIAGEVKTIEMHHETLDQALPGDNVGFNVRGVGKNDIKRGDVLGHPNNPPTVVTLNDSFKAQIVVLRHPTAITVGYTPVFHCHTAQIACTFEKLIAELDPKTGNVKTENPDFLKSGSAAIVQVKPTKPMVIEEIKILPQLGRFAVRDMGATVAAGMVQSIQKA